MCEQLITLYSSDKRTFTTERSVIMLSKVIRAMVRDCGHDCGRQCIDAPIPIPFRGDAIERVLQYCAFHSAHPEFLEQKRAEEPQLHSITGEFNTDRDYRYTDTFSLDFARTLLEYDEEAREESQRGRLFAEVLCVADFLDIQPLCNLLLRTVARKLSGCSSSAMRAFLHLPCNLSPEDIMKIEAKSTGSESVAWVARAFGK